MANLTNCKYYVSIDRNNGSKNLMTQEVKMKGLFIVASLFVIVIVAYATPTDTIKGLSDIAKTYDLEGVSENTRSVFDKAGITGNGNPGGEKLTTVINRVLILRSYTVEAASKYDLDLSTLEAIIATESGGKTDVVSSYGAVGPMQIMPRIAKDLGCPGNLMDPATNIDVGAYYLSKLAENNRPLGYIAGPKKTEPSDKETRNYVNMFAGFRKIFANI